MRNFCGCAALLLAAILAAQAAGAEPSRPVSVGHRGLMHAAPECTLAGFRACVALKVGFEFDVRQTKDGELVCLHDATLDRTTTGHGKLADWTGAELAKLDAGVRFDTAFRGERVPRMEDILKLIGEQGGEQIFAVDLKETGGGLEEKIVRLAERHRALDRLLFIGATIQSADVRSRLKAANKSARTARLAPQLGEILAAIGDSETDWIYLRFVPAADEADRIHAAGKRIFVAGDRFAGQEPANWAKAAEMGVDAVLTDFPLELARQLRGGKLQ
jgi:glycerophosphoryl diester phosphodiesterase